jgi:hypothetical protein
MGILQDACEHLNTFYVETGYPVYRTKNLSYEKCKPLRTVDRICSVVKGKIAYKSQNLGVSK